VVVAPTTTTDLSVSCVAKLAPQVFGNVLITPTMVKRRQPMRRLVPMALIQTGILILARQTISPATFTRLL
jgi:hypothetical protein